MENAQKFLEVQKLKRKKHLEELSTEQKSKVDELNKIQDNLTKLQKEFDEEFKKLEAKYTDLKTPLFKSRTDLVNEQKEGQFTGIPNFWYYVLKNSEVFADIMSKRDEEAVKCLTDIVAINFDDEKEEGYHLDFYFRENQFFENKVLRKTFSQSKEQKDSYPKGTKIDWKKDMNLTVEVVTKKKKHKGGGKSKTVKKTQPCESFFNFFNDVNPDDLEEEDLQMFNETLEADMECGDMINEEIIPNAIQYYLGEADSVNPLSGMMDMAGGDDEDDEEGDDEEQGVKFDAPKGGKKGEKDAECEKQQQ